MRDVVLADDDFDVDAEIVGTAEHLDHAAFGGPTGQGEVGDLNVDGEAFEGLAEVRILPGKGTGTGFFAEHAVWSGLRGGGGKLKAVRDEDGLAHALVERGNKITVDERGVIPGGAPAGARVVEDADDGGGCGG